MSIKIGNFVIRPEIEQPVYWLHVAIIAIVILGILQLWKGGNMFTFENILASTPLIALGDIISHSLLSLD